MKILSATNIGFFIQSNRSTPPVVLIIVAVAILSQLAVWFYIGKAAWKDLTESIKRSDSRKK